MSDSKSGGTSRPKRSEGGTGWLYRCWLQNLDDRGTVEWRFTGQKEIPHCTERVQVDPRIDLVGPCDRFGGHIKRAPRERVDLRHRDLFAARFELLDQAEVDHLDEIGNPSAVAEHDVGGLDVAVN